MTHGGAPVGRLSVRRRPGRLTAATLLVALLAGLFGGPAGNPLGGPAPVRGDDLSAALTQQQALQAQIAANEKAAAQLSADQANLTAQIQTTRQSLVNVSTDLVVVQGRITTLAGQVAKVKARYDALVAQLASLERQLAVIEVDERSTQNELAQRKAVLSSRLRAAYRTDQTSLLETVLSAESFTDVLSDVGSYMDIAAQDRQLAQQIVDSQETLAALHQTVTQTHDATDQLRQQTADQKAKLDQQMAQLQAAQRQLQLLRQQIAAQLAAQKAAFAKLATNKAAVLAQAEASQAALDRVNAQIQALAAAAVARGNIPSIYNGSMIWPMGGEISQDFGCTGFWAEPPWNGAPYGYCAHFHQGIDSVAPCLTPIYAAADGVVIWADYMPPPDGAWDIEIAHSSSLITLYGHMAPEWLVRPGDVIRQGQLIGHESTTGNSTGCHLHWAVYQDGIPVNPRLFT